MARSGVVRVPIEVVRSLAAECEVELPLIESSCENGVKFMMGNGGLEMEATPDGEWRRVSCLPSPFVSFIAHGAYEEILGMKMAVGTVDESMMPKKPFPAAACKGHVLCRVKTDGKSIEMEAKHSTGKVRRDGFFSWPAGFVELESGVVDLRSHPWSKKKGKLYTELSCPHRDDLPRNVMELVMAAADERQLLAGGRRPGRREAHAVAKLSSAGELSFTLSASKALI